MDVIYTFIENNIWLCLGALVIVVIVVDEVFGFSRNVFGDDDPAPLMGSPTKPREEQPADPLEKPEAKAGEITVADLLTPKSRD